MSKRIRQLTFALGLASLLGAIALRCGVSQPGVGSDYSSPKFVHTNFQTTCIECHEKDRPISPHVQKTDCVSCHNTSDTAAGWLPLKTASSGSTSGGTTGGTAAFSHVPAPTSCITCHADDRPAAPHTQSGDCVSCHSFPKWKP